LFAAVNAVDRQLCAEIPWLGPHPVVVYGPSGVGKHTVLKRVFQLMPQLRLVQSVTTRKPRFEGEPGYIFVDEAEFWQMVDEGLLAEHAQFAGSWYGSLRTDQLGGPWLYEIEIKGAMELSCQNPNLRLIRLEPPGLSVGEKLAELRRRLAGDVDHPRDDIDARLLRAKEELDSQADKVVINDDADRAATEICWYI
jgi:guanylate kinase